MRAVLLALLVAALPAQAQSLPGGQRVEFGQIFGHLFLPEGTGRRAALVIVHGSGGVSVPREGFWAQEAVGLGMVALVNDSFTPRGVESTVDDQSKVTTTTMVRDAFAALEYLARQDFVDPARVAIIGFSKGGSVAILAADQRAQTGGRGFAAHIPLYPGCTAQYRNPKPAAPILVLIGEADNYTGVKNCAAYVERIRAAGGNAEMKLYKGAHHGFDGDTRNEREFFIARAQNFRDCLVFIEDDLRVQRLDPACIGRGATVGANHRAKMQALDDVKEFLKATLKI
jgi:dienelactone hydrolase